MNQPKGDSLHLVAIQSMKSEALRVSV